MSSALTLSQFILQQEERHPDATGEFTGILFDLALAAKRISREVTRAGLVDILGLTGATNIQGEKVAKLDEFAQQTILDALGSTEQIGVMASEESKETIPVSPDRPVGKYAVNFDPLDGSSNVDANINIGTIFSVLPRVSGGDRGTPEDCMQPGCKQLCAGYVVYGPSTMLVFTTGNGVHGFTLGPDEGEFLLSHPDIKTPARGKVYSINEGNRNKWSEGVRRYVDWLQADGEGRPYSARYVGSLVADFHRTSLYGGIFMYPADSKNPNGKLRVLYECAPMAKIIEQAGGAASDGVDLILDIIPDTLHQRTPLFIGSVQDVDRCLTFVRDKIYSSEAWPDPFVIAD